MGIILWLNDTYGFPPRVAKQIETLAAVVAAAVVVVAAVVARGGSW